MQLRLRKDTQIGEVTELTDGPSCGFDRDASAPYWAVHVSSGKPQSDTLASLKKIATKHIREKLRVVWADSKKHAKSLNKFKGALDGDDSVKEEVNVVIIIRRKKLKYYFVFSYCLV